MLKTRKSLFLLILGLFVFLLTGCPGPNTNIDDTESTSDPAAQPDSGNTPADEPITGFLLPAIRIQTTNPKDPANPLAFVTDPVSDTVKWHAIKTWSNDQSIFDIPAPWYEECTVSVESSDGVFDCEDVVAKVKARGNYTTTYPKKGLRIKFDKKQSMLGLHNGEKYKNWVLLGEWKDFSMVRNMTALNLSHLMSSEYYASDYKFVEVYINDQYWGVYLLVEQQEDKRVGITEAEENDGIDDTGYLLEYDGYGYYIENVANIEQDFIVLDDYGTFNDLNDESTEGFNNYYTIKSNYDDSKKAHIKEYMDNVWSICYNAIEKDSYSGFNSAEECISQVVDIDSLVDTFIQQEIACDLDLNWSSFYMDVDLNPASPKRLTFEAPWDFDSSFGNHKERQIGNGSNQISHLCSVTTKSPCRGNPWTVLFAKTEWFQKKVQEKWASMNAQNVKGQLINKINAISNDPVYVSAFKRNYQKWNNIGTNVGDELCAASVSCKTQRQAANLVINFLNQRWAMLDKDFETFQSSNVALGYSGSSSFNYSSKGKNYTDTLTVEAKEDGLHITRDMDSRWNHVSLYVHDETDNRDLPHVNDIPVGTNNVIYEYVTKDHVYSLWLESQFEDTSHNWGEWHSTKDGGHEVKVISKGGLGNVYINTSDYVFDKASKTITFDTFGPINYTSINELQSGSQNINIILFDGHPWWDGVSAFYGMQFISYSTNDGKGAGYTFEDNERNNEWISKDSGGIIIEWQFTDKNNSYIDTVLNDILWEPGN